MNRRDELHAAGASCDIVDPSAKAEPGWTPAYPAMREGLAQMLRGAA